MHNLTPDLILQKLAQQEEQGQLAAVVLFVDTSGFTPLTTALQQHGPEGAEIIAQVLANLFTPLVEIVYRHGGFIAGFAGDAFKAIFPGMTKATYQRALTAAWQIRQHLIEQPVQQTRFGDFSFAIKVTVADGSVEWAIWQSAATELALAQRAAALFGGAALAQALAADPLARAGEVVLTPAVAAQIPWKGVTLEPVDSHFRLCTWPTVLDRPLTASLDNGLVASVVDLATRFFPAELLARRLQGEFRRVVTVFINVQQLPSRSVTTTFASILFSLLSQYGGYLCRIGQIGDQDHGGTLLLFWGAPTSHEQDVARALQFVLALQTAAPTRLRAGITTQLAYAGFVGAPQREEYTCYGAHVNLAARQMVRAEWDEIWLDDETARLAGATFVYVRHGSLRFKGFSEERTVYRLLGRGESSAGYFYPGALVGRQAEMAQLAAALAPLAEGKFAGVLTILGEAGIGKSRLVHELKVVGSPWYGAGGEGRGAKGGESNSPLAIRHPSLAPQWFLCQTDEILRQPLNPFRYWLRNYFQQSASADEATNKAAFNGKLDDLIVHLHTLTADSPSDTRGIPLGAPLAPELARTRSFLGALVDLHWPDSLYAQVEPQLRFENTLAALKTLILAESLRQPVILHLEDAHWLDVDSQTLLARLTHNVADYPLAVIITRRPGDKEIGRLGDWEKLTGMGPRATIQLMTLTVDEIRALAAVQLRGAPAQALVTLLEERAEGNPFFAEQLLHYLQDQGWLMQGVDGWQLRTEQTPTTLLPNGARALLVARLDQLPQPVKEVVQTAAVLGREFDTHVLAQMLANDKMLADKLAVADRAAIWSAMTQARYLFRHALLREAAYDMQLRARLRTLHRLAGAALEQVYGSDLTPYFGELAYHYDRAEVTKQAVYWYGRAGEQAAASYANHDAVRYFSRALDLTTVDQAEARFKLLLGREAVYEVIGKVDAQRYDIEQMEEAAVQLANMECRAQTALRSAMLFRIVGDYESALTDTQHALRLAEQANNLQLIGSSHHHWGRIYWTQGDYDNAQHHLEQALQLAQVSHHTEGEARALTDLGSLLFYQGKYTPAETRFTAALKLYQTIGHRKGEISSLAMLGTLANETADYEASLAYYQAAQALSQSIGYLYGQLFVLGNLGMNYICVGQYEQARHCLLQAITNARECKDTQSESVYLDSLAVIHLHCCDAPSAIRECQQALAIQQAAGYRRFEAYSLTYLGDALHQSGDLPAASLAYEQALTIRHQLQEEKLTLEILVGLAQVRLAQGQVAAAQTYLTQVFAWLEAHGIEGIEFPVRLYLSCYHLSLTLGDPERAQILLATGYELLQSRALKIRDAQLRQTFLQAVPFNRELVLIWHNSVVA